MAHDCENATSFYQFQDVRNFKSKIGEKYNSETTESEIDQESTTKKPRRIKKANLKMRKKNYYYLDITGSETEEDYFQKNNETIRKRLN